MELIIFIIVIVYIVKAVKKADENDKRRRNVRKDPWKQVMEAMDIPMEKATRTFSELSQNNTTILQRAMANVEEDRVDVTLESMEAEHNHSERVSAAVHHHPEDEIPENMLGSIEDLMIKGYEGNLCFERDFVGEGQDMINRFTYS